MRYIQIFQLQISLSDFKDNVRIDNALIQKINEEFNTKDFTFEAIMYSSAQYSITSSTPFTKEQVELISKYFNIPEEIKKRFVKCGLKSSDNNVF